MLTSVLSRSQNETRLTDAWYQCTGILFSLTLTIVSSLPSVAHGGAGVWTSGGPYGGYISALAINPSSPSTIYAGTQGSGVFRSTDSGTTWAAVNTGLTSPVILALAINPSTSSTLFVGTSEGGVFKSTNSGGTWVAANTGLTNLTVNTLAINPSTPSTLYAGTYFGGVFKSTDSGGTWVAANTRLTNLTVNTLAINPSSPSTLYAGTGRSGGGVFKSTNAGATWVAVDNGLPSLGILALAINPLTSSTLYAGGFSGGVFTSTDSGATWTANTGWAFGHTLALAINPLTPSTLYAGTSGGGVFKSTDSGGTWAAVNTGLTSPVILALAINPSTSSTLFVGTSVGGVFKSTDSGGTWAAANTGLSNLTISSLAISPSFPSTVYAGTQGRGVFKSTNSGGTWVASNTGLTDLNVPALAINPSSPSTLYVGTYLGGVFKSTDSGGTWTNTGLTNPYISALATSPSALYVGTYPAPGYPGGVFKSTDSGGTWAAANTGLSNLTINTLAINPSTPSTLYAGTRGGGIFKSTNSGGTWAAANTGLSNLTVNTLAINPSSPSTLYAGTSGGGVFKSTNSSGTWAAANTGLPNLSISSLAISPSSPSSVYAGTQGSGVFKSTDSGGTWVAANTGLPNLTVNTLAINPSSPSTLYAGPNSGGVWQYTTGQTGCTLSCAASAPTSLTVNVAGSFRGTTTAWNCSGSPSYSWNFDDTGVTFIQQNFYKAFTSPGTHSWSMSVTQGGMTCTVQGSIQVGTSCTPSFVATVPTQATVGVPVPFILNATANPCNLPLPILWQFGENGATSKLQSPAGFAYSTPGQKAWQVTVTPQGQTPWTANGTIAVAMPAALDHFDFDPIGDQIVDKTFAVTLRAKDAAGNAVAFSGQVNLGMEGVDSSRVIDPAYLVMDGGVATPNVTVRTSSCNARLTTLSGSGKMGTSGAFSVSGGAAARLSGVVRNASGPVAGATVTLAGGCVMSVAPVQSDASGAYSFQNVAPGQYQLSASKAPSSSPQATVLLAAEITTLKDLTLPGSRCNPNGRLPVLFVPGALESTTSSGLFPSLPRTSESPSVNDARWKGWLFPGLWELGRSTWSALFDELQKRLPDYAEEVPEGGFIPNACLLAGVPYDWRLPNEESATKYLKPRIDEMKLKAGVNKVYIVAHSMGGLVTRAYIEGMAKDSTQPSGYLPYGQDIERFAMVGTPNAGGPNAYPIWEGIDPSLADSIATALNGEAFFTILNNIYTEVLLDHYFRETDGEWCPFPLADYACWEVYRDDPAKHDSVKRFVREKVRALGQLMPVYAILDGNRVVASPGHRNVWLEDLNISPEISRMSSEEDVTPAKVKTKLFAGVSSGSQGPNTIDFFRVGLAEAGREYYPDGEYLLYKPTAEACASGTGACGDGTVLRTSVRGPLSSVSYTDAKPGEHSKLVGIYAQEIVSFLFPGTPLAPSTSAAGSVGNAAAATLPAPRLHVRVEGGVGFILERAPAEGCGVDPTSRDRVVTLAGCSALEVGPAGGEASVDTPLDGSYVLVVHSATEEQYRAAITFSSGNAYRFLRFAGINKSGARSMGFVLDSTAAKSLQATWAPTAPTGFRADASAAPDRKTLLSWAASSEPAVVGYKVYGRTRDSSKLDYLGTANELAFDPQLPWADSSAVPVRIFTVTAVLNDGTESVFSEFVSNNDRDHDGISDVDEEARGLNPDMADTDGDGLLDGEEVVLGTDPLRVDSDGDGFTDREEKSAGSDPLDPLSVPCVPGVTATVTGDGTISQGGTATLTAVLTGTGPWTLTWSDGYQQVVTASPATRPVSPQTTTIYRVVGLLGSSGCHGPASGSATVNVTPLCTPPAAPIITQTAGANPSCAGASITLDAGAGYTSYLWSTGATTRTITASPAATATYTVTGANAGCTSAAGSWTQTVNAVPAAPMVTAPSTVGAGSPNGTASVPVHVGSTYSWTIGNGTITSGQGTDQITFTAGTAGAPLTLWVTETNASGCESVPGNATAEVTPVVSTNLFYPLPPCRVLDTRNQAGPLGAPALSPNAARTFDPTASACGIPADAVAISANLAVTNVGALGELVVFPSDILKPNASALSFRAGRTRANNAIVSFSKTSATFSVFNNSPSTVDFILDVNGFFR